MSSLEEEATESKGIHFASGESVLQKLQSYGEASNLSAAMAHSAPIFPLPMCEPISEIE